jgi:hypothetical protein
MGIIIRQKSMIMYFLLFVIVSFLDYKKDQQMMKRRRKMEGPGAEPEANAPGRKVKLSIAGGSKMVANRQ